MGVRDDRRGGTFGNAWPQVGFVRRFVTGVAQAERELILSVLYRNRGDGTFEDASEKSGTLIRTAGMGVAWGDYDGDGMLDLFVSAMYANSRWACPGDASHLSNLRARARRYPDKLDQ